MQYFVIFASLHYLSKVHRQRKLREKQLGPELYRKMLINKEKQRYVPAEELDYVRDDIGEFANTFNEVSPEEYQQMTGQSLSPLNSRLPSVDERPYITEFDPFHGLVSNKRRYFNARNIPELAPLFYDAQKYTHNHEAKFYDIY